MTAKPGINGFSFKRCIGQNELEMTASEGMIFQAGVGALQQN